MLTSFLWMQSFLSNLVASICDQSSITMQFTFPERAVQASRAMMPLAR